MAAKCDDDDSLLPEIWTDILHRLPIKLILRCRAVCKSWYSLISCPNFISDYSSRTLTLNKSDNCVLLQLSDYTYQNCSFSSHNESFTESCEHDDVPETFLGEMIVGSCNGLICLCSTICESYTVSTSTFLIWNPAIRKTVELPCRTTTSARHSPCIGFGFDSNTNDHKVLCSEDANVFGIFDLNKGAWRSISPMFHSHRFWRFWSCYPDCYVNGAVHWTGYKQQHGASSNMIILSFDMTEERFREIKMPDCAEFRVKGGDDHTYANFQSVTFGGLVYVMVWKEVGNYDGMSKSLSFWAMKEYGITESWTKVYNIDMLSAQVKLWPCHSCLWDNDEVLMVHNLPSNWKRQTLDLYNTKSREYKRLFSSTKRIMSMHIYKKSLFLMRGSG